MEIIKNFLWVCLNNHNARQKVYPRVARDESVENMGMDFKLHYGLAALI